MVFSSPEFIFGFMPIVFAVTCLIRRFGVRPTLAWLSTASLFFYGVWRPEYLLLIAISILANWWIAKWIRQSKDVRLPLTIGVLLNLGTIGYFKYADFAIANLNWLTRSEVPELGLLLPLGISFFTFQQIAFLVDTAKRRADKTGLLEYVFFVSFFPQLIAGPIVHHRHILPKIRQQRAFRFDAESVLTGIYVFVIGFAKKVIVADSLALAASAIFDAVDTGHAISAHDAVLGTLSYSFQIYFDFSGYTDMAIGLGLMFGLQLPKNFDSPYKATGIIDFWRRWHMTLSEFLKDYVYIPLGGNRLGATRRYANLLMTMLIGGLWHGASWTFVLWGGLHGLLLIVNHSLRSTLP